VLWHPVPVTWVTLFPERRPEISRYKILSASARFLHDRTPRELGL